MARQHLARDLCVARLVGAHQTHDLQSQEKQKSAKGD
jgi:hypothetical protein